MNIVEPVVEFGFSLGSFELKHLEDWYQLYFYLTNFPGRCEFVRGRGYS